MNDPFTTPEHIQGSVEWLAHRNNYIGASEAATCMGIDPWRTPYQLWEQKLGMAPPVNIKPAMQRGTELEPVAREAFELSTGLEVFPQVVYHPQHNFMMSSMDGLTLDKKEGVEIKCPGEKTHRIAREGKVPEHYMPQMQHQLACLEIRMLWYYSFDGRAGVAVKVHRDEKYIERLIESERKFWKCVTSKTPPEMTNRDYVDRSCATWVTYGKRLAEIDVLSRNLKEEREEIKESLIEKCCGRSSRGSGLTLTRSIRKGNVDYGKIPQLDGVDLEQFRKKGKELWTLRIRFST